MPEVELNAPRVLPIVGELEAGGVAQHVRVNGHAELGIFAGLCDDFADCPARDGTAIG